MAKIFISHSSKDKKFVRKLAGDLKDCGHIPWLDEWEIQVGECIAKKIEEGISDADYVVIVLSSNSTQSEWFDREWKSAYWDEVNSGDVVILPVLVETCTIPKLLHTKKYADFRSGYSTAFDSLLKSISSLKTSSNSDNVSTTPIVPDISSIVVKLQSSRFTVSECIADALSLGKRHDLTNLVKFCTGELTGWPQHLLDTAYPDHRLVKMYASFNPINMEYFGWNGDASRAMEYIKDNASEFIPTKILFNHPISKIESDASLDVTCKLGSMSGKARDLFPAYANTAPDVTVYLYTDASVYKNLLSATKNKLTKLLIELM